MQEESRQVMERTGVFLDDTVPALVILDQTQLPNRVEFLSLSKAEAIWQAIHRLQVRGAPAIGVAAAIGMYVLAAQEAEAEEVVFRKKFAEHRAYLATSRPTAVNLFWALDRMQAVLDRQEGGSVQEMLEALRAEAIAIREEDIACCRSIGEHGLSLLKDGAGILTHCNAGQLATVRYGTALAPIHLGRERGMHFHVFTDETRPLLQGARLSAYELVADGVETTLLCDNMASQVMKNGWVDIVLVGADRIAANGDTANKIGTSGVAILANYYNIPFYVCAPTSTIDRSLATGAEIPIEERKPEEVTEMWYAKRMAPEGVQVYNPAFDVTDHRLITGIVTEKGIVRAPYTEGIAALFEEGTDATR